MSLILYLMNGKLTEVRTDTPSVNILKKISTLLLWEFFI